MKLVSAKDDNGKVYEFETVDDIRLAGTIKDRIVGCQIMCNGSVSPRTWSFDGVCKGWTKKRIHLTPYDKFKDLKKAFSEGAKVEFWNENAWDKASSPTWSMEQYRIKDNISIESWNAHKDVIKEYWNGGEVETYQTNDGYWYNCTGSALWDKYLKYRIKQQSEELTLEEVCEALGRDIKIVKG